MSQTNAEPAWNDDYAEDASSYLKTYFGGFQGLTAAFPCMRDDYPWADHRPDVPDSRIPAKNNTEYHGLESLAGQYHSAAMYEEAGHHWLMAAWCRHIDMKTHGFSDTGHSKALSFCLKNHAFNEALYAWSQAGGPGPAPEPARFGLTDQQVDRIETEGAKILDDAFSQYSESDSGKS